MFSSPIFSPTTDRGNTMERSYSEYVSTYIVSRYCVEYSDDAFDIVRGNIQFDRLTGNRTMLDADIPTIAYELEHELFAQPKDVLDAIDWRIREFASLQEYNAFDIDKVNWNDVARCLVLHLCDAVAR